MTSSTANSGVDGCLIAKPADQQETRAVAIAPTVITASHIALQQCPVTLGKAHCLAWCPVVLSCGSDADHGKVLMPISFAVISQK